LAIIYLGIADLPAFEKLKTDDNLPVLAYDGLCSANRLNKGE
jgi:hypothetical protein